MSTDDKDTYSVSEPEFAGNIPIRTEITVPPGDPEGRKTIGWTCYEVAGTDVHPIPEGQDPSLDLVTGANLITKESDHKPGMHLLVHDLFGGCHGIVHDLFGGCHGIVHGIVQADGRSCLSLSGKTTFFLEFVNDRPPLEDGTPAPARWVCTGSGNLAAIKKLELHDPKGSEPNPEA